MCGIIGIIKNSNSDSGYLYDSLRSIHHRGPDDSGAFEDNEVFIGNQRLSIQDISMKGHQPMQDISGRYVITYNGEVYNHQSIRKELSDYGYTFRSHSDTETILYGYIHFGMNILNKLNGIFAFIIYDTLEKKIFGARDPMGVKPFYYYSKGKDFAGASELKSLIHLPFFDREINYRALVNYINFLWSPGELTPFKFVFKLLPGQYFTIDAKYPATTFKKDFFFSIPFKGAREFYSEKVWIDTVDRTLTKAVDRQLLSDAPIGFFLSGGVDSSVVVAEARKMHPDMELNCFTIKYNKDVKNEGFKDDYEYAKQVAKHLGVTLHTVEGGPDILNDFDKMIWHLDEPQADIAPLHVYRVSEQAHQMGIKVLLSGVGGDDLFSGYRRHQALFYDKYLQYMPKFFAPMTSRLLGNQGLNNPTVRRINKFLKSKKSGKLDRIIGYYEWFPAMEHLDLFSKDMQNEMHDFDPNEYFYRLLGQIPDEESLLNKMLYLELKTFLVDHNLNYTDKMGMAGSVEIRVPYLDLELVKLSAKIPPHLKLKGTKTKYILRKVAERYLPNSIVQRSKTGFGAPVRQWIMNDMAPMVRDRLSVAALEKTGIFNPVAVQQLLRDTTNGKIDGSYTILSIMSIESWMQQFYVQHEVQPLVMK